jgi:predicted lipoprotein with Yx(FWY)xxD motif
LEEIMSTPSWKTMWPAVALACLALTAAACGASSSASTTGGGTATVTTRHVDSLGATVLADARGRTLYTLSAERNGKFICTSTSKIPGSTAVCTSLWHPLIVRGPVTASGVASLGTVVRPDGAGRQVTYHGLPLYTFAGDHGAGAAAGNGFHDVGTWKAATVGGTPPPASSSGGGGYANGY